MDTVVKSMLEDDEEEKPVSVYFTTYIIKYNIVTFLA